MKKGFTLIELLAVIVILAIIALIATPIILGIINDARKESHERSAELYASAVKNAMASYQLTHPTAPTSFEDLNVQYDGDVVCGTEELYKDGSFYITDCTVNGDSVDYTYGEQQITQVYKPQYYSWDLRGTVDVTPVPSNPLNVPPTGKDFYLGYDVGAGNKVTAAYVCFTRNGTEYCLKGADSNAYEINKTVLEDAFKDVKDDCYGTFNCFANGLYADASLDGIVSAFDDTTICTVSDTSFLCM